MLFRSVMCEFGVGDLIGPGTGVGPAEDPEICFNLLVDTFCFAVRLRVIGGREGKVIVKEFTELLGESGGELWATIGDDLVVEPESKVYFVKKRVWRLPRR